MAEKIGEVRAQSQARNITLLKRHATIEVLDVDDADTITVDSLTTIDAVTIYNAATASTVAADIAGNVITINDVTAVNSHVILLAIGS